MRTKIFSLFLLCLLVCLPVTLLVTLPVKAQADYSKLRIWLDKPYYYILGETVEIRAYSNISVPVTLSVFWNWRTFTENTTIYQDTRMANATWFLPTATVNAGFYEFRLNCSNGDVITTRRTVLHLTDYSPATIPFNYTWSGITYSFLGRRFIAYEGADYIQITYPKIPFSFDAQFFFNNMSFLVRLNGSGWRVDQLYFLHWYGLKWVINGTLDNPGTFDFQLEHNPIVVWHKHLNSFRSVGHLVMDWSDLEKTGQAFSYNYTTKTLHVEIPSTFSVDPYIFEDGFELGDGFGGWDSTAGTPVIVTSPVHHGVNACECDAGGDYVTKTFSATSHVFIAWYMRFNATPTDTAMRPLQLYGSGIKILECYAPYNSGGTDYLRIYHYYPDGAENWEIGTWSTDTWYHFEVEFLDSASGHYQAYLDGEQVGNCTHDTSGAPTPTEIYLGIEATGYAVEIVMDCVYINDTRIGEESALSEYTFTLYENPQIHDDATGLRALTSLFYENLRVFANGSGLRAKLASLYQNIFIFDNLTRGRALSVLFYESVNVFSSINALRALSAVLNETISYESARIFANLTTLRALIISLTETFFENVLPSANLVTETQVSLTLLIVLALASIAFVIAIAALTLAAIKKG